MTYPDWVLKHKTRGTELRKIRDKYYMYNITSKWDPVRKKARKVTLGQVGVITQEHGLVPTGMMRKGKIPKGKSILRDEFAREKFAEGFIDDFTKIDDPRSSRNQLYSIAEIFLVTFCAALCGAEGWQDIEDYGKMKLDYLRQYLDYRNGTPSDDTIRRFFRAINPEGFEKLFRGWISDLVKKEDIKVIAIDGKSSRHSFDGDNKMLHTISAFATDVRMVLGQEKVSEKSNEITAIPRMLEWLDVQGHIVTIDAMGCQYEIANKIIEKTGDYIFALKGNQGALSADVELFFKDKNEAETDFPSYTDYDKGHGRVETRQCWVVSDVVWLRDMHPDWQSIQSIVQIDSTREIKDKITKESRYYISSLKTTPKQMLANIRSHWAIENSLHWVLDMSFNEDQSRIRKQNAPYAMAIIRHIASNLLQSVKKERQSIKRLRKMCGWSNETLDTVIAKKFS